VARVIHKKTGNFLEDFRPGQVFRHKLGKTVTEGLFTSFTEFSMTTNPLAKNARYARAYGFDGLVVPPGLAMLVAFSQTVEDVSENARANLEYIDMRFGAPVYVGDSIEVITKVLGIKTSASRPNLGVVHVQSTARKNVGEPGEAVVMTWQRKVQVYKGDDDATVNGGEIAPDAVACELRLPPYDAKRDYKALAHLSNADTYWEDFEPGTRIEHSRGRTMTSEHIHLTAILDNTSQVHCNQHMIDQNPEQYVGGQLIIFGGIPFVLCLGLSCPTSPTTRSAISSTERASTRRPCSRATPCSRRRRSSASASCQGAPISASSRRGCSGTSRRRRTRRSACRSSSWTARSS
jgi:2-methylfumaryl-CoA hydratase